MQPEDRDPAWLWDAIQAARAIVRYTGRVSLDVYRSDELLRSAVERQFTVLGESMRRMSDGFRARDPHVPWRQIIDLRNVLVHRYETVDNEKIWTLATNEVPALIAQLEPLLPPIPPDPEPEAD